MLPKPTRRRLLIALGGVATAGCTTSRNSGADPTETTTTDESELPEECPTTQNLGVEWPSELDSETVESFVESYEATYYREKVVGYESESMVNSYELGGRIAEGPTEVGDGYTVEYAGGGGIYRPTLRLMGTVTDQPENVDIVSASDIDDETLSNLLANAAETGDATRHIDDPGESVDEYIELLASLSADFEELTEPSDSDTLYVDVDGTIVKLTAQTTNFHGDYSWNAWYYVDENVVRRTTEEETEPQDGKLLECRSEQ
ncbi:hypothetical protein [Salinibaculum salinum]|uniref:hypothetical protein n=1 Tax=Salinibaculum salinum TaxID=3131996 RepID=UPI0030ECE2F0